MKALLKKDLYLCKELLPGVVTGGVIFVLISKNLSGMLSFLTGIAFINTLSLDTISSFYSYGMTLPIEKKKFVQVKFVEYLGIIFINILFMVVLSVVLKEFSRGQTIPIIGLMLIIFSYYSLYIPPALMGKRSFNFMKVLIILFPVLLFFIAMFTKRIDGIKTIIENGQNYIFPIVGSSILLLIISYLWSLAVIKKREY